MKKYLMTLLMCTCIMTAFAQDKVEWDGTFVPGLQDFRSPQMQISPAVKMINLNSSIMIELLFQMSGGQFMFTKNFNDKLSCTFNRSNSFIVAPDTATALQLVSFAVFDFDLAELYTRKMRQRLYEEKRAFSRADFFRPVYEQLLHDYEARRNQALKDTEMGQNGTVLQQLHTEVKNEIAAMAEYCKACKPSKKKTKAKDEMY